MESIYLIALSMFGIFIVANLIMDKISIAAERKALQKERTELMNRAMAKDYHEYVAKEAIKSSRPRNALKPKSPPALSEVLDGYEDDEEE